MGRMKEAYSQSLFDFDGRTYEAPKDKVRLNKQGLRVFLAMQDARWRTLGEIEAITGDPQASISARLRDFRKDRFGAHTLDRRRRGYGAKGLFEYRLIVNPDAEIVA